MSSELDLLFNLGADTNIQWQTLNSNSNSILFYRFFDESSENLKKFQQRLKDCEYKYCVTNIEIKSDDIICLSIENFLKLQFELLLHYYPINKKIKFLGVTGTNGKTTTVDLIRQISIQNKKSVMTFGTLGVYKNEKLVENFNLTTPTLIDAIKTISKHSEGLDFVVFELSSHALVQERLGGLKFNAIGWTNFTQDHLDYHKTMDEYFAAKALVGEIIVPNGKIFLSQDMIKFKNKISFNYEIISNDQKAESPFFKVKYNLSNLNLAFNILKSVSSHIKLNSSLLSPPPGRFDIHPYKDSYIIIDYAHTPDALESICKEVKSTFKEHDLKVVFGCGGNRDKSKRKLMGAAASKFASFIYITNDNPRFEKPLDITREILEGVTVPYVIETDRKKAIEIAINDLTKNVLIIAGKGHEDYMEIEDKRVHFSDKEVVGEILND